MHLKHESVKKIYFIKITTEIFLMFNSKNIVLQIQFIYYWFHYSEAKELPKISIEKSAVSRNVRYSSINNPIRTTRDTWLLETSWLYQNTLQTLLLRISSFETVFRTPCTTPFHPSTRGIQGVSQSPRGGSCCRHPFPQSDVTSATPGAGDCYDPLWYKTNNHSNRLASFLSRINH